MKIFTKRSGVTINVSSDAVIRSVLIVIAVLLGLNFIGHVSYQLQLIGVAAFLALALNPAVSWIVARFKLNNRLLATAIAYLIVLSLLISFLAFVLPPLVRQSAAFLNDIPQTVASIQEQDTAIGRAVERYDLEQYIDRASNELDGKIGDLPAVLMGAAGRIGGTIASILAVLVLTFMMLVEGPLWLRRIWALTPEDKLEKRQRLAQRMYRVVTGYVNGQVLLALVGATFGLFAILIIGTIFDVTLNAIALAGILFLFGLIPLIGNTLGASIVVLVALFSSLPMAITLAIWFLIYQQIENITFQPIIQSKANQLTPLVVFVAAIVGAGFGGLLGAFVAIPVAGCIKVLLEERYGERMPNQASVKHKNNKSKQTAKTD